MRDCHTVYSTIKMDLVQQPTASGNRSRTPMYPSWIKAQADLLWTHRTAVSWTEEYLNHLMCPCAIKS